MFYRLHILVVLGLVMNVTAQTQIRANAGSPLKTLQLQISLDNSKTVGEPSRQAGVRRTRKTAGKKQSSPPRHRREGGKLPPNIPERQMSLRPRSSRCPFPTAATQPKVKQRRI